MSVFPTIVYILLTVVWLAMFGRIIFWLLSMFFPDLERMLTGNFLYQLVFGLTEPVISPLRAILPTISRIDIFSFIFANVLIQIVRSYVGNLAGLH